MRWADVEDDEEQQTKALPTRTGMRSTNWADVDDDDNLGTFEPQTKIGNRHVTQANKEGIRVATEYLEKEGQAVKITSQIREKKVSRKTNAFVDKRKAWKAFGKCHLANMIAEYGSNKPVRADEEMFLELNKDRKMKSIGEEEKFYESSIALCDTILNQQKQKAWDAAAVRKANELKQQLADDAAGAGATEGVGIMGRTEPAPGANRYVPPSMRGLSGKGTEQRAESTLRVQNLSEEATDGDIHALFSKCGMIHRVFLAKHRDGEKQGLCKGFAFVTYRDQSSAEQAIKKLNNHGFDNLILQVSWAKPREN